MASRYVRLLDPTVLVASAKQDKEDALDLGAYTTLQAQVRVLEIGGAGPGNVYLEHAAVNEPDAYVPIAGTNVLVTAGATGAVVPVTGFLRFVRWATDAGVVGAPVVLIDIVAKE